METPFKIYEYGTNDRGTIFIFGGWRSSKLMYQYGIRVFVKLGWRCILFIPDNKLIAIGTPYQSLIDAGEWADNKVSEYIAAGNPRHLFMSLGVSLGTMYAAETAKRHSKISRLIMTAPFGDFADHVVLWQKHHYFKRVLASQPTDIDESAAILNQFGTSARLDKLADKRIMILRSSRDTVTHAQVAEKFVDKVLAINPRTVVNVVPGGHFTGIFRNYVWLAKNKAHDNFFELPKNTKAYNKT